MYLDKDDPSVSSQCQNKNVLEIASNASHDESHTSDLII